MYLLGVFEMFLPLTYSQHGDGTTLLLIEQAQNFNWLICFFFVGYPVGEGGE